MKELFTMWRHTNMVVLVALSAAMYAAVMIPFQAIPIIPGHVSLRVATILPVALGLLFGPAGAWGCGIGNLIGDFFGSLSPGSLGGFAANFMHAFLAYKLWNALSPRGDFGLHLRSRRQWLRYEVQAVINVFASYPILLTWWVALFLGLAPGEIYLIATTVPALILYTLITPVLVRLLYPRVKKWGLLWSDVLRPEEVSAGPFRKLGVVLTAVGAFAGTALIVFLLFVSDVPATSPWLRFGPIPFLGLVLVGAALMGGREQVEAGQVAPRKRTPVVRAESPRQPT